MDTMPPIRATEATIVLSCRVWKGLTAAEAGANISPFSVSGFSLMRDSHRQQ
jgi:hypothetical protein